MNIKKKIGLALIIWIIYIKISQIIKNEPIDLVYTWVDGNDPKIMHKREEWSHRLNYTTNRKMAKDSRINGRFEQFDELKYSLRSVENFAPWIRRIYIVTDQQIPTWLKKNINKKLRIVDHRNIIDHSVLPTFNSHVIEANLHRIPGISRRFIYLNDDCFFGERIDASDFLTPEGKIKVGFEKSVAMPQRYFRSNEINSHANAVNYSAQLLDDVFGFQIRHFPRHQAMIFDKKICEEVQMRWKSEFHKTISNRFRSWDDIHPYTLYAYWALNTGQGVRSQKPHSAYLNLIDRVDSYTVKTELLKLKIHRPKLFCLNNISTNYSHLVQSWLEEYFPHKSSFE
jgi:hypothetical protein